MSSHTEEREPSSFRDPSGFVFVQNGMVYRKIHQSYKIHYDALMESGLYEELTKKNLLIPHQEKNNSENGHAWYKTIQPVKVRFISYPYEWSFGQLRDAALATLEIQKHALAHNMTLKDASAYNIQFVQGKPLLIDTLSFETYEAGKPWVAYKQFCQHFLAPLAVLSYTDLRLGSLLQLFPDGVPLEVAAKILPKRAHWSFGLLTHLFWHARSQVRHESETIEKGKYRLPETQLRGILESLEREIRKLKFPLQKTAWGSYYDATNYTKIGLDHKARTIQKWITEESPRTLWDIGANDAYFSRFASERSIETIATDMDPVAIEKAYQKTCKDNNQHLLPLIIDINNPSPSRGWNTAERKSFLERMHVDMTLCLALIHHLCITNNMPFEHVAQLFSEHTTSLVIEFVPAQDSNAERLIKNRDGVLLNYSVEKFESAFTKYFEIAEKVSVEESTRTLYLMRKKHE